MAKTSTPGKLKGRQNEVTELYENGATLREIARVFDVRRESVSACLGKAGVPLRAPGRPRKVIDRQQKPVSRHDWALYMASKLPRWWVRDRARLFLLTGSGVTMVSCPACDGRGWINERGMPYCPICCCFGTLPEVLARYIDAWMRSKKQPKPSDQLKPAFHWRRNEVTKLLERGPGRISGQQYGLRLPLGAHTW